MKAAPRGRKSLFLFSALFTVCPLLGPLCNVAPAQTYLYNTATFATGNRPTTIATGYFDADDIPDLAALNAGEGTASILLGTPEGGFRSRTDFRAGPAPTWMGAGDLNGDGVLDLFTASARDSAFSIILGNGDGTFQPPTVYLVDGDPDSVAVGYINDDANMDLAVVIRGRNSVSVYLGTGGGVFELHETIPVGTLPSLIVGGDFNGDGRTDFIVSNSGSSTVSVLLNGTDGSLTRVDSPSAVTPTSTRSTPAVGDFNADGKLDVALNSPATNALFTLLGRGDGTFLPPRGFYVTYPPYAVTAADVDRDGKLDMVWTGGAGEPRRLSVMRGNGDGTFQLSYDAQFPGVGGMPVIRDINRDGHLDLVVPYESINCVGISLGNGDGTFGNRADYPLPAADYVGPALPADFNNDGKLDVAVILFKSPTGLVSVLLGNGDGTFPDPVSFSLDADGVNDAAVGDFNADGKVDIAVLNSNTTVLSVYLGNGNGGFQPAINSDLGALGVPQRLHAGSFDGDSRADLVLTTFNMSSSTNWVNVLLSNGNGTFRVTFQRPVSSYTVPIPEVADFNHDSRLDVALNGTHEAWVFLGNGDGTLANPTGYPSGDTFAAAIEAKDFNADGNVDMAVGTWNSVVFLAGNGDGTFRPMVETVTNVGMGTLASSDLAGNGKLDLLAEAAMVFPGNGDGTFGAPITFTGTGEAAFSASGDFDSDGTADLVLPNRVITGLLPPYLSVFLSVPAINLSPMTLQFEPQEVGTSSLPQTVTLTNIGNAPLLLSNVWASADFAATDTCDSSIAVSGSCSISVVFSPRLTGTRRGTLTISGNTRPGIHPVALTGTGAPPPVSLTPTSLAFGEQLVGSESSARTLTLTNNTSAAVAVQSIAPSVNYAKSDTCQEPIPAGQSCSIQIKFTPTAVGSLPGSVVITHDGPNSPLAATLAGTGTDLMLTVAPGSSTSATITAGQSATYTLALTTATGFNQTVSFACNGAPSRAACTVTPTSVTPNGSSATTITVNASTTARSIAWPEKMTPPGLGPRTQPPFPLELWLLVLALAALSALQKLREEGIPGSSRWAAAVLPALLFLMATWAACGGGGGGVTRGGSSQPGTPPGTYTLTVAGSYSSGSNMTQRTVELTLKVN